MQRSFYSFTITDYADAKQRLIDWLATFNVSCFLDNHNYTSPYHSYNCLAAAGHTDIFQPGPDFFASLSQFVLTTKDWIFGHLNYDIKNEIENITSHKPDHTGFPDYFLFVPELVIQLKEDKIIIGVLNADPEQVLNEILRQQKTGTRQYATTFKSRAQKEEYVKTVQKLKEHIHRGDCYEINYCQEFFAEATYINPVDIYNQLTNVSPNPFSCFYKVNDKYVLCASPERYLKKQGEDLISQPIKGTAKRDLDNKQQDQKNKDLLSASEKDKRENVIVVDLVRNDLNKICEPGTVTVQELFGIYSFPTVHQMISTVCGRLKPGVDFSKIIEATFPMGSMTGAPKKKVMQLIEQYEFSKRGIYSGTIGYISPEKDFDFNVVIRSLVYNAETGYISYHTGGGITYLSDPYIEYEECLTKAASIFKVFG